MKKRIVTIALVVALLATCFAGTYAYLTDFDQVTNEFTIGDIAIDLYETVGHYNGLGKVVNGEQETDLGRGTNTTSAFKFTSVMPGDYMQKTVTVENTSTNDAYIALVIKQENYYNFNQNVDEYYEPNMGNDERNVRMQAIIDDVFPGWELNYAKDDSHIVRYMMNKPAPDGMVLGYGYVNSAPNAQGTQYYNYAGEYFTNGINKLEVPNGEPNFMSIGTDGHPRAWIIYLKVPAYQSYTVNLGTACPYYFDNNSVNAFEDMVLDVKAFAIQAQGLDAKNAFAEVLSVGGGFGF